MNYIEINTSLKSLLNAINSIPVNGNNVYTMAAIMNTVLKLIGETENKEGCSDK